MLCTQLAFLSVLSCAQEYCGAFNARHLGYPCQCGCGRLVTLQAGNIVRRHGDKLDRLPFLLDDCRTVSG